MQKICLNYYTIVRHYKIIGEILKLKEKIEKIRKLWGKNSNGLRKFLENYEIKFWKKIKNLKEIPKKFIGTFLENLHRHSFNILLNILQKCCRKFKEILEQNKWSKLKKKSCLRRNVIKTFKKWIVYVSVKHEPGFVTEEEIVKHNFVTGLICEKP